MRILPYLYLADAVPFFEPFNFDTLLALISCIAGIVALFVGGKAYKTTKLLIIHLMIQRTIQEPSLIIHNERPGIYIIKRAMPRALLH